MLNRIIKRLGLVRQDDVIEAMLFLRHYTPQHGWEPGYISDRQWRHAMNIARGEAKAEDAPNEVRYKDGTEYVFGPPGTAKGL